MKKLLFVIATLLFSSTISFAQPVHTLDTVVVTATRYEKDEKETGSHVTVISQEEIQASNAKTLNDLLSKQAGLNVYQLGTPNTAVVDLRGFGETAVNNTLILVDGIRVNPIDISGPNLTQIPVGAIERIEIIRGSGSILYGDNATGGVINIITKKGGSGHTVELGGSLGSYKAKQKFFALSGDKNKLTYNTYSSYSESDGYRDNSYLRNQDHHLRLGYDVTDQLGLELIGGWHQEKNGLPAGLTYSQIQSLGRRASTRPNDFNAGKDRYVQLRGNLAPWNKDDFGHFEVDYVLRDRDTFARFVAFGSDVENHIDSSGATAKYVFKNFIGENEVNFVTGVDYFKTQNKIFRMQSSPADILITKREIAGYTNAEVEVLNDFFVNAGSRYQQATYDFDSRGTNTESERDRDEVVSGGGVRYDYAPGSNVHASVQQTFRFPATDEFYSVFPPPGLNADLQPQKGIQYEVGIKHNIADVTTVSVTPYWLDLEDELFLDPLNPSFYTTNVGDTRRIGIEIGQETNLLKIIQPKSLTRLTWNASLVIQEPKFRNDNDDSNNIHKDDIIPLVPKHTVTTSLMAQLWNHYEGRVVFKYVGAQAPIGASAGYNKMKAYNTTDLQLAYKQKNYEVYGAVNNLFDQEYSTYKSYDTYYTAPELNYEMGVNIKF